jgi:hypothetical protein
MPVQTSIDATRRRPTLNCNSKPHRYTEKLGLINILHNNLWDLEIAFIS